MKTKNDYLNDADFREVAMTAYNHQAGLGVSAVHCSGNYTARQFCGTYPSVKYKTINIYKKGSMFLLAQVVLNLTNKTLTTRRNGSPEARAALVDIFLKEGFIEEQ